MRFILFSLYFLTNLLMLTYSFIPEASLALSFTEQIQKILIDLLANQLENENQIH